MLKTKLLPYISKAINQYLHLDPESKQRLSHLKTKTITIELLPLHFMFQCVFTATGIKLKADETRTAEATIRGTPLQMMGVMLAKDNRQQFFADDLVIEGDAEFAQDVILLFDQLQIDWEEYLSQLIGDTPTYHVGRFIKRTKQWFANTDNSFSQNINEFIHEEAMWLPAREALQDLFTDIDNLRMDVDRIAAKLQNLSNSKGTLKS